METAGTGGGTRVPARFLSFLAWGSVFFLSGGGEMAAGPHSSFAL